MNIGNILKVADAIEQHSVVELGFNMGVGIEDLADCGGRDMSGHSCGTVACIAGWTAVALRGFGVKHTPWMQVHAAAIEQLGLTQSLATALFYPEEPDTGRVRRDIGPDHAARALRNLVITGKVDWDAAMLPADPVLPALPSPVAAKQTT